jgi:hypothetical protein
MTDKKKLTKEYKQTLPPMGILQIMNKTNGRIFLLKTKNLPGITNSQKFNLNNGSHPFSKVQQDYTQIGESIFSLKFSIIWTPRRASATTTAKTLWLWRRSGSKSFSHMEIRAIIPSIEFLL